MRFSTAGEIESSQGLGFRGVSPASAADWRPPRPQRGTNSSCSPRTRQERTER